MNNTLCVERTDAGIATRAWLFYICAADPAAEEFQAKRVLCVRESMRGEWGGKGREGVVRCVFLRRYSFCVVIMVALRAVRI